MTQSIVSQQEQPRNPLQRAADLQPSLPVLSKRRLEFLKIVFKYFVEHGNFPTTIEIAGIMGLKYRSGAHVYIMALIKEECLVRDATMKARYIRFTDTGLNVLWCNGINVDSSIVQKKIIKMNRSDT